MYIFSSFSLSISVAALSLPISLSLSQTLSLSVNACFLDAISLSRFCHHHHPLVAAKSCWMNRNGIRGPHENVSFVNNIHLLLPLHCARCPSNSPFNKPIRHTSSAVRWRMYFISFCIQQQWWYTSVIWNSIHNITHGEKRDNMYEEKVFCECVMAYCRMHQMVFVL